MRRYPVVPLSEANYILRAAYKRFTRVADMRYRCGIGVDLTRPDLRLT